MATKTIAEIVQDIRTAIYGREVRESLAQGIETCYSDVTEGKTIAEEAADKIEDLSASATGLAAGASPTVSVSEVSGHKHISFGIPQGIQGVKGDTGAVPNITVGTVTTLLPGSNATVTRVSGSPNTAPVFNFGIPKGDTGSIDNADGSTLQMSPTDSRKINAAINYNSDLIAQKMSIAKMMWLQGDEVTASNNYSSGDYIYWNSDIWVALSDINIGDLLEYGTNVDIVYEGIANILNKKVSSVYDHITIPNIPAGTYTSAEPYVYSGATIKGNDINGGMRLIHYSVSNDAALGTDLSVDTYDGYLNIIGTIDSVVTIDMDVAS